MKGKGGLEVNVGARFELEDEGSGGGGKEGKSRSYSDGKRR